jgi:hypothetical protein
MLSNYVPGLSASRREYNTLLSERPLSVSLVLKRPSVGAPGSGNAMARMDEKAALQMSVKLLRYAYGYTADIEIGNFRAERAPNDWNRIGVVVRKFDVNSTCSRFSVRVKPRLGKPKPIIAN